MWTEVSLVNLETFRRSGDTIRLKGRSAQTRQTSAVTSDGDTKQRRNGTSSKARSRLVFALLSSAAYDTQRWALFITKLDKLLPEAPTFPIEHTKNSMKKIASQQNRNSRVRTFGEGCWLHKKIAHKHTHEAT